MNAEMKQEMITQANIDQIKAENVDWVLDNPAQRERISNAFADSGWELWDALAEEDKIMAAILMNSILAELCLAAHFKRKELRADG